MAKIGRPLKPTNEIVEDIIDQLLTQYIIDEDGCHIWTGQYYDNGYGRISRHHKRSGFHGRAHVASYQYHIGHVPDGLLVCHECDKKGCINPECLWVGTNQENQLDASSKGASTRAWTEEKRLEHSMKYRGELNPMYGVRGKDAPCYGRTGDKHPMFGKHHTEESKAKISAGTRKTFAMKRASVHG